MADTSRVRLAHGFGGRLSQELIDTIIIPALSGETGHAKTLDAAVLEDLVPPVIVSTDSYTISPWLFPGGNIGKLAVAGTVNDICMMGAEPKYMSLGLIIEEGFLFEDLRLIMQSLGDASRNAGVRVVTGDTKVVEKGVIDGIFINTTGLGTRAHDPLGPEHIEEGDVIIISGTIGDHGASILNARENLGFGNTLLSDCASLHALIANACEAGGQDIHALRDPTRGGLAATLNEFVQDTGFDFVINEEDIPVKKEVSAFLSILGLDALTLANEGKVILIADAGSADTVLEAVKKDPLGRDAAIIGNVTKGNGPTGRVIMKTAIGTKRYIDMPLEAGLPRIC